MGNAISVNTQTYFFTSCMAKYTCITKPQVMAIRNILFSLATVTIDKTQRRGTVKNTTGIKQEKDDARISEPLMIRRRYLYQALQKANIVKEPDQEILDLLFTMWTNPDNEKSKTQAPWYEYMISLSLLACKTDTLDQALRFALHVVSRNLSSDAGRTISASDAITFLKGFCTTASYFGDAHVLQSKQIFKIVDQIFDTISMISSDDYSTQQAMSCDEFVKRLLQQKSIQDLVVLSPKPRNVPWTSKRASSLNMKNQKDSLCPETNDGGWHHHENAPRMEKEPRKDLSKDNRDAEESTDDDNSLEDCSIHDDDDDNNSQNGENKTHPAISSPKPALKYTTTRPVLSYTLTTLTPNSVPSTDMSSNVSSVKLTPLAHIAISSHNALDIPNIQNV